MGEIFNFYEKFIKKCQTNLTVVIQQRYNLLMTKQNKRKG